MATTFRCSLYRSTMLQLSIYATSEFDGSLWDAGGGVLQLECVAHLCELCVCKGFVCCVQQHLFEIASTQLA